MTGRWDSTGKLEAAIIKKLNEMFNFRYIIYSYIIKIDSVPSI